jgi:short-subunit dehydrogenase
MTTVLITGASSGVGLALARRFAAAGYDLVLVARSGEKLKALASEQTDVRVLTVAADLASSEGAGLVLATVARAGPEVDLLVNNAGAGLFGSFARTPIERELAMVQLNIGSLLQLTKGLLPGMLARGRGHIVNVASVAAFVPGPNQSVYYATKAFVRSFSDSLAAELRGTGVAVTAAYPGPVATGFHAAAGVTRTGRLYDWFLEPPGTVAEAVYQAVERRAPSVVPGLRHRVLFGVMRMLPRGLVGIVGQAVRRSGGQADRGT